MDRGFERHPILDLEIPFDQPGQRGLQAIGFDLGEEANLAQVDAEQRHVYFRYGSSRPQERTVAAQDDENPRLGQLFDQGAQLAGRRRPVGDAAQLAPAFGAFTEFQRRFLRWVVGEADALELHAPANSPNFSTHSVARAPGSPSRGTKPAGTSSSRKNSRLPAGPVSGDATALRNLSPIPIA